MRAPVRMSATATLILVAAALLSGCGNNMSDLKSFVARVKTNQHVKVKPPPKLTSYKPYKYVAGNRRGPFTPPQGDRALAATVSNNNGVHPNFNHKRGPLEHFPLDALRMVGTLSANGTRYALISSPDGIIHRVSIGDYMGQNYGKIVKITSNEVKLREIVPDGFGGYLKRPAEIALSGQAAQGSKS